MSSPWEDMPSWERAGAAAVKAQVVTFLAAADGWAASLSRSRNGQFAAERWAGQVDGHLADLKASYAASWEDRLSWQPETDADIFERWSADCRRPDR